MAHDLVAPAKASPGDRVAVLSPSFAAPGEGPAVHEQAMRRLTEVTGLLPVEYPTTRRLGASPTDRAADLNAAFRDPQVRAVLATIGGDDQITVVPHLDGAAVRADPKPFLGYSDNTNILSWLWTQGVSAFYGGSTQVQLGPGPAVDACHVASLRAALLTGGRLELTEPGESEDFGRDWADPAALTEYGERESTEPWAWAGPRRSVTGRTWGGCVEVLAWVLTAGRFPPDPAVLAGHILLLETSEDLTPAPEVGYVIRSLGSAACSRRSTASSWHGQRHPTSSADPRRPTGPRTAEPSATRCSRSSVATTRPQWSAWACRSATPDRSGSCPTAGG